MRAERGLGRRAEVAFGQAPEVERTGLEETRAPATVGAARTRPEPQPEPEPSESRGAEAPPVPRFLVAMTSRPSQASSGGFRLSMLSEVSGVTVPIPATYLPTCFQQLEFLGENTQFQIRINSYNNTVRQLSFSVSGISE